MVSATHLLIVNRTVRRRDFDVDIKAVRGTGPPIEAAPAGDPPADAAPAE